MLSYSTFVITLCKSFSINQVYHWQLLKMCEEKPEKRLDQMLVTYTFTVYDGTINVSLLREAFYVYGDFHCDGCRLFLKTLIWDININLGKKINTSNERARRGLSFDDRIAAVLCIPAALNAPKHRHPQRNYASK